MNKEKLLKWLKSRKLWLFLGIMYLISPKAFTLHAYFYLVHPLTTYAEVNEIKSAYLNDDGNVVACLSMDPLGEFDEWADYEAVIPVKDALRKDHPRYIELTTREIGRGQDFILKLDETTFTKGCKTTTGAVLNISNKKVYASRFGDNLSAIEPGELALSGYASELVFRSSKPLRRVTFESTETAERATQDEYHIIFRFPQRRMPFRWWNLWILPPAILGDAITGPLLWIPFVGQHSR